MASSSIAPASVSASGSASLFHTSMPLTTIFTPASSCSERPFTYFQDDGETSTFWRDMYLEDTDCYPWSYAYQHEATVSAVYSPGVCPEAYYAAQYTANGPTGAQTSWCCPTGMTYGTFACQSLVTSSTTVIYSDTTTLVMTDPWIAADWYIQVAWAQDNLNTFTPASAPVLTTTSTTASSITSLPTRVALGPSGPTKAPQSAASTGVSSTLVARPSSMSTGAKAGIGVGVALGCIAVVSAIAFLVLRRRRKQKWAAGAAAGGGWNGGDVKYGHLQPQPAEIHEVDSTSRPVEVEGQPGMRAEMHGSEYKPYYRAEMEGG